MSFKRGYSLAAGVAAVLIAVFAPTGGLARAAAAADPPDSTSDAVGLAIPAIPAAGIPGFTGDWAVAHSGSSGGTDALILAAEPSDVRSYVSVATGTSTTIGTVPPYSVSQLAETSDNTVSGPSLIPGGPKLVTIFPEVHNVANCTATPPTARASSAITPNVVTAFGNRTLVANGPAQTVTGVTGSQLGLGGTVSTADLTYTLTKVEQTTATAAHAATVLTITGTLYDLTGAVSYSGPLATLTLGDVTADCSTGPTPANVRIVKSAQETVPQGGTVTYTLDVSNDGPGAADGVTVTDELNQDLTMISVPSGCTLAGSTVTCVTGTLAAGASERFTITARVPVTVPVDTSLENCAAVSSSTPQVSDDGKASCASTTVVPDPADVTITKSGPATVAPGGAVTYPITITNHGPDPAFDTVVSDVIPGELTGVTAPAGCTLAGQILTCDVGTLGVGDSRTFTITATAAAGTADGTVIANCATGTTSTPETDYLDNVSCVQTTVTVTGPGTPPTADVAITKTGPAAVPQGGTAAYTLAVANHGTADAADTVVSDVLPAGLTVTGVPAGCTLAGRLLSCDAGTLAAGDSRTFTVQVLVSADAAAGYDIENCATATTTTDDSDTANNGSCTATRVERAPDPDVAIVKTGPGGAAPGEPIAYTLIVTNLGHVAAAGTVASDVLPAGLAVTGTPAGCRLAGRTISCAIGTLRGGAVRMFVVSATVSPQAGPGTVIGNCAAVYTDSTETDLADNASCLQTAVTAGLPTVPVTG